MDRTHATAAIALFLLGGVGPSSADDTKMVVRIERSYPGNRCTSGYLSVNGRQIVYTLERPWIGNFANLSAIPPGTYPARLRYDKRDHWRIELEKVPGRTGIQIHVGNEADQSKGCVLVGEALGPDLCSLHGSQNAYKKLRQAFYGTESPGTFDPRDIEVVIAGASRL